MKKWITAIARHPAVLVVPIGVMLFVPFMDVGPIFDDFYHLAILEQLDPESEIGPLSLWAWHRAGRRPVFGSRVQGDPLPWWAARDLHIDFFRPLPSLVHQLDHAVYGRNVVGWHVTSLAMGLLVILVHGVYAGRVGARTLGETRAPVPRSGPKGERP